MSPSAKSWLAIHSRGGAYVALVVLTLVWGINWLVMKRALRDADPMIYNIARIVIAIVVLFGVLVWKGRPLKPVSWIAVCVTGFLQTTVNMGSTVMALVDGGAGRTSVLAFTMPFWTILFAWPVLHERLRALQWVAVALAAAGLTLVVEPWNWQGHAVVPKLWALLSGLAWAAGTIAIKHFLRDRQTDMVNFMMWQMTIGLLPCLVVPFVVPIGPTDWSVLYFVSLLYTAVLSSAVGFLIWFEVLRWLPAGTASMNLLAVPMVGLFASMAVLGERIAPIEWIGIGCIGIGLALVSLSAWRASRQGKRDVAETPLTESS
jgi:drug/metabolite transporter (DMT)-like permease